MAPAKTPFTNLSASATQAVCERSWVRIRFRKDGDLRLVSHHDLMHCFERMLRRAGVAFCSTAGFHPRPRMNFALALGLGIVGGREVVDIEFDGHPRLEDIQERLRDQAPPGLTILDVQPRPGKGKAQVRRACYRLAVPADRLADLPHRLSKLLATRPWLVQRSRPRPRSLDIRPYLGDLRLHDGGVAIDLWVTPTGTARPEEVLRLLGLDDLLAQGAVLERVDLEIADCGWPIADCQSAIRNPQSAIPLQ